MHELGSLAPEQQLSAIWQSLADGVASAPHPFHTSSLATLRTTPGGPVPVQRTVVLRDVAPDSAQLVIHTDARSPKVADIRANPAVSLLFYDVEGRRQLSVTGRATVHSSDELVQRRWEGVAEQSRQCYRQPEAPGTELGPAPQSRQESQSQPQQQQTGSSTDAGRDAFAVIVVHAHTMEALFLDHVAHLRRRWDLSGTEPRAVDLAP